MTSIERTAYPRFPKYPLLRDTEVTKFYTPTKEERILIEQLCEAERHQLNFALLYKTFQKLGYFPDLIDIPKKIIDHIKILFNTPHNFTIGYKSNRTKRHHQQLIKEFLGVSSFDKEARHFAVKVALTTSQTMNNPADIINVVVEELIHHRYELPAYSTLDRLVRHSREYVNNSIFKEISIRLTKHIKNEFDIMIQVTTDYNRTGFNDLKKLPKRTTITHFQELLSHHE